MERRNLELSLLEQLEGQIIEVTEISMVEDVDKEETKEFGEFEVVETEEELILRDNTNEENNIHIRLDNLFEIEEDCDNGYIELVCLNRIIRVNQI